MRFANPSSKVLPAEGFLDAVVNYVGPLATYPPDAVRQTKALVFSPEMTPRLKRINHDEMELLVERMMSEECQKAVYAFLRGKSLTAAAWVLTNEARIGKQADAKL